MERVIYQDVAIAAKPAFTATSQSASAVTLEPVECLVPIPKEQRESYLLILARESREVVSDIETLSPINKRPGSNGQIKYLTKHGSVLLSQATCLPMVMHPARSDPCGVNRLVSRRKWQGDGESAMRFTSPVFPRM